MFDLKISREYCGAPVEEGTTFVSVYMYVLKWWFIQENSSTDQGHQQLLKQQDIGWISSYLFR